MVKQTYRKLTDKQIISLFRYHHPKNIREVKKLGIKIKYLDKGIDRLVYQVGKRLALKMEDMDRSSLQQTPSEIESLRKAHSLEKFKPIRQHVPKLYYANADNGVMLVSYHPYETTEEEFIRIAEKLQHYFPDAARDFHEQNFRKSFDGTVVCVDLGYSG